MQTKTQSVIESLTNIIVGLITSFLIQLIIYPLLDIPVTINQNLIITMVFFIASFLRGYLLRRFFKTSNKMNIYKKYCPNVFIAQCDERHQKGDTIILTTKYGKEHECIVHNFIGYTGTKEDPKYCYSITRADGFDNRERARKKVEKLNEWADNAEKRSDRWRGKSNEGKDFLSLGEPIKVGHHSEKRHRALIERNWTRMTNAMNELQKAEAYRERTDYWESMANVIDLSMPESIEFFQAQLEEATEYHKGLKDGSIKRQHSYSLTYAKKRVNDLTNKVETAKKLWA